MSAINSSASSLSSQHALHRSNASLQNAMARLSSGLKINTGKDDPAGLVISEQLLSQQNSTYQAVRNNQETSNVLSIAEGGLSGISSMLDKAKSLAVHASNTGVTSGQQTSADQAELNGVLNSINQTVSTTGYSSQKLLNGTMPAVGSTTESGVNAGEFQMPNASLNNIGKVEVDGETYSLQDLYGGGKASLAENPVIAQKVLEQATQDVAGMRASIGAYQSNTLESTNNALNVAIENITATGSGIRDQDMAAAVTQMTTDQIMQQAGTFALKQNNHMASSMLKLLSGFNG